MVADADRISYVVLSLDIFSQQMIRIYDIPNNTFESDEDDDDDDDDDRDDIDEEDEEEEKGERPAPPEAAAEGKKEGQ